MKLSHPRQAELDLPLVVFPRTADTAERDVTLDDTDSLDGGVGFQQEVECSLTDGPEGGDVSPSVHSEQHAPSADAVADFLARGDVVAAFTTCALSPDAGPPQFEALLHALGTSLGGASAVPSDASVIAAFIAAASKCGAFPAAAAAFEASLARGERSTQVFNAHIAACGRAGQPRSSDVAFAVMKAEGVRPSVVTYNALISAHASAGDLVAARRAFADMRAAGEVPNERTYGALLAAAAAARNAGAAVELYQQAVAHSVSPNAHMVSSLLTALARGGCGSSDAAPSESSSSRAGSLAFAWESVTQLRAAKVPVNAQIWSALATLCGRAGAPARALDVLRHAEPREAFHPFVLASVLTACRNSPSHATAALASVERAPLRCRTTVVQNACLALRAGTLGDVESAERQLHAMAAGQLGGHARADATTYATFMAAAAHAGHAGAASRAFEHMTKCARLTPTPRVLAALVSAVGRGGTDRSLADAQALVDGMAKTYGVAPNQYVYSALMDAHVKSGDTSGAFDALARMRACGLNPNAVTFGILLDGCRRTADVAAALNVARDMAASGVPPSDTCANLLVVACSRAGMLDDMLTEVRALARRGGDVQRDTLDAVLTALCRFHYAERAIRVRALMAAMGVVPSASAFSSLTEAVAREGMAAAAYDVATDAATHGVVLSPQACTACVCALCRSGELDRALWVAGALRTEGNGSGLPSQQLVTGGLRPRDEGVVSEAEPTNVLPVALLALATACARVRRVDTALRMYRKLLQVAAASGDSVEESQTHEIRPEFAGRVLAAAGLNVRARKQLYDTLVAACALTGRLDDALDAYDASKDDFETPPLHLTTLASLEAACKRSQKHQHRVWDVCAGIRRSRDAARQRKQVTPRKKCHHVGHTTAAE